MNLYEKNQSPCLNKIHESKNIHSSAIIENGATIAPGVTIGPYSIIGKHVTIDEGTTIASHVTVEGWSMIGKNNLIGTGTIIGGIPQDLKFIGEKSQVIIGDNNIIREYVTINRGTAGGGNVTSIGDYNTILTSSHIAHDVIMGNHCIISNNSALAGHVILNDWVTIGGLCGIHQFVKIGKMVMIGALSYINKDIIPYSLVAGNPAKYYGINVERLKRNQYSLESRNRIKKAHKYILQSKKSSFFCDNSINNQCDDNIYLEQIIAFIKNSKRNFYR